MIFQLLHCWVAVAQCCLLNWKQRQYINQETFIINKRYNLDWKCETHNLLLSRASVLFLTTIYFLLRITSTDTLNKISQHEKMCNISVSISVSIYIAMSSRIPLFLWLYLILFDCVLTCTCFNTLTIIRNADMMITNWNTTAATGN